MTAMYIGYRLIQISVFGALFLITGQAMKRRQADMNAEGREIFLAFYWLSLALLLSVLAALGLHIQINWAGVLVLAAVVNCIRTLVPRRRR